MDTTSGGPTQRRLELVAGAARRTLGDLVQPTRVWGTPFRPGELPRPLSVRLTGAARSIVNIDARHRAVPVELALRVKVEAARALDTLGLATGAGRDRLARLLEACAHERSQPAPSDRDLRDYLTLLRARGPSATTQVPADGTIELLIPPQLALAWRDAAGNAALDHWVSERVCDAPPDPWSFEIAAALRGASVPEWAYASWLRLSTRSSALPHART